MAFNTKKSGFTVVELMIAISIFGIAVVLVTTGVIFIGRQYKQASTRIELESASREIHQQIAQSTQFSGAAATYPATGLAGYKAICFGDKQYIYGSTLASYNPATYTPLNAGLYSKDITYGTCPTPVLAGTSNLLPASAKVIKFDYSAINNTLSTVFVYAAADLLNISSAPQTPDNTNCVSSVTGKEYCSVVRLESTTNRRVTN